VKEQKAVKHKFVVAVTEKVLVRQLGALYGSLWLLSMALALWLQSSP
jgi:hypothetical protein